MKNHGFSLIEVLAALALTSMALGLVFSIWHSGVKQGNGNKSEVLLQQEAQIIAETLRNTHLMSYSYKLNVDEDKVVLDNKVLSGRFNYQAEITHQEKLYGNSEEILVNTRKPVSIKLVISSGDKSYTLRTTLARGT